MALKDKMGVAVRGLKKLWGDEHPATDFAESAQYQIKALQKRVDKLEGKTKKGK